MDMVFNKGFISFLLSEELFIGLFQIIYVDLVYIYQHQVYLLYVI